MGAQTSRGNKGKKHLAGGSWGVPLGKGKRRSLQRSPKEEEVRAFKENVPRDTEGTTSQPQLLLPAEACHLLPFRSSHASTARTLSRALCPMSFVSPSF